MNMRVVQFVKFSIMAGKDHFEMIHLKYITSVFRIILHKGSSSGIYLDYSCLYKYSFFFSLIGETVQLHAHVF